MNKNWLLNLPLRTKIWAIPGILGAILVGLGALAFVTGNRVSDNVHVITGDLAQDAGLASDTQATILLQRLNMKGYLQTSDAKFAQAFHEQAKAADEYLAQAVESIANPERARLVKELQRLHQEYDRLFDEDVMPNMNRRHELVETLLDANGKPMEDALSEITESAHRDDDIEAGYQAGIAMRHLLLMRLYVYKFLMNNDTASRDRVRQEVQILEEELQQMHDHLQNPQRVALSDEVHARLAKYREGFEGVVKAIETRNVAVAQMDTVGPQIAHTAEALQESVAGALAEQGELVNSELQRSEWTTLAGTLIALVIGGLISWFAVQGVIAPLRRTNAMLGEIAEGEGDLTKRLPVSSRDELGELAGNFNRFVEKLQGIIGTVQNSATQMAAAAEELSVVSGENNQVAQQQLSEADQVATAVEEMSATLQEVARNVQQTAVAADAARTEAANGREVENKALESIQLLGQEIQASAEVIESVGQASEQVHTVVEMINGIAEQTNLLALNAAIEAARAGEQGRGFAVVADEVRTLAGRTRESTEEIAQTIEQLRAGIQRAVEGMSGSRAQADTVVSQAQEVDRVLASIVDRVQEMDGMASQIATATEEQTAVANDVAQNVVNLKDQTDHSATATSQVSSSAGQLAQLAAELQGEVGRFKISG